MIFDTFSITVGALLVLLSLVTPILNPFFRIRNDFRNKSKINDNDDNEIKPKVSVLLLAYDDTQELQNCISAVLNQKYNQDFEIIVIIEKGDIIAENTLSPYLKDKRIYVTFVPSKPLFMSRQKLAISLGVKAAHNEWITIIKSNDIPASENWLSALSRHFKKETSLIIGYANYEQNTKPYYRFIRLRTLSYLLHTAIHNTAYRSGSSNIAFRKSTFIDGGGYRGNLQLVHGEFDFIINKYAVNDNTGVEISPDSFIREKEPTKKEWNKDNISLYYMNKVLRRTIPHKLLYAVDVFTMYINYIAIITMMIYSATHINYILLSTSIFALILTLTLRTIIAGKAFRQYGENIAWIKVIPYELSIFMNDLIFRFKYLRSDKNDFTTHKI